MKRQILEIIYTTFEKWSKRFDLACERGCAVCCTQDVLVTEPEAALLLDFIIDEHGHRWLAEKLSGDRIYRPLSRTTNEYAASCLAGEELIDTDERRGGICPFLDEEICTVYAARPFSCRCFASTRVCRRESNALLPRKYLSAATAVSQIVEHLGQFSVWGNMSDVLYLLAPPTVAGSTMDRGQASLEIAASSCLTAQPLPGFLIEEDVADQVGSLLKMIFKSRVGEKTVEDILNNR